MSGGNAEARQVRIARQFLTHVNQFRLLAGPVDRHRAIVRIDRPHQSNAGLQVAVDLAGFVRLVRRQFSGDVDDINIDSRVGVASPRWWSVELTQNTVRCLTFSISCSKGLGVDSLHFRASYKTDARGILLCGHCSHVQLNRRSGGVFSSRHLRSWKIAAYPAVFRRFRRSAQTLLK